jgi:putative N6-adenine-specific DNA methylase
MLQYGPTGSVHVGASHVFLTVKNKQLFIKINTGNGAAILSSSLEKRIKRNVSGRKRDFFVITPPGMESLCRMELMRIPSFSGEAAAVSGGVEFCGKLYDGYLANIHLRTATRILMRIETVSASHFIRLSKKAAEIPWELYMRPDAAPMIRVSTRHCRLYHRDAVAAIFTESVRNRLLKFAGDAQLPDPGMQQRLFIRGEDDSFRVSMDSSGDLLYKRGVKMLAGKAPVRETLAVAILMLAGYSGNETLVNPMCGSGTFAVEGALMARNIPPGWHRSFAFMGWPGFKLSQWQHIRNAAEKRFISGQMPPLIAFDNASTVCDSLTRLSGSHAALDQIQVLCGDFFDLNPGNLAIAPGLVVINPPYGKRMGTRRESRLLIQDVMKKLKGDYRGWRFALIIPERSDLAGISPEWRFHSIYHGGLKLELLVGNIWP